MTVFWVVTFYAVSERLGCKRRGRRKLLKNELKEYLGEECDPSLGSEYASCVHLVKILTSRNWNLVRGLKGTQDFKQEEILLLAMEKN